MELYRRLEAAGYHPWMDKYDLLPGQDWETEIKKIIGDLYNLVVICLSKTATTKRGVVQKEIKWALDTLDKIPEGEIFIIPARLEKCQVPNSLSRLHRVDLFEPDGFEYLKKSLLHWAGIFKPDGFEYLKQSLDLELSVRDSSFPQDRKQKENLSLWNPLDYVRLLWWLVGNPEFVRAYQNQQADQDRLRHMSKWLISTLIWVPNIIALGTLSFIGDVEPIASLWLATGIILAWLITGWLADGGNRNTGVFTSLLVSILVTVPLSLLIFWEMLGINEIIILMLVNFGSVSLAVYIASLLTDFSISSFRATFNVAIGVSFGLLIGLPTGIFSGIESIVSNLGIRLVIGLMSGVALAALLITIVDLFVRVTRARLVKVTKTRLDTHDP